MPSAAAVLQKGRKMTRYEFHDSIVRIPLWIKEVRTSECGSCNTRDAITNGLVRRLGYSMKFAPVAGPRKLQFCDIVCEFLQSSTQIVSPEASTRWTIARWSDVITQFRFSSEYAHLVALDRAAKKDPELAAVLGNDYTIAPDIVMVRGLESDESINGNGVLVDGEVSRQASLRESNGGLPLLHASISCKWTIRSDRVQNARSEALNLIRNRKGRLPHVVVVTGEPLPSRLSAIALGTGDIDCVYHFALPELIASVRELELEDTLESLNVMVNGKRLKDISDLPLDLAV
jgi:hypothetical protein